MKNQLTLAAGLAVAALASSASAQFTAVAWDLTGKTGSEVSVAATATYTGITALNLTRGSGLTATNAGNSFSSGGFEGASASATEYISFGFSTASAITLDSLYIGTRSSGTGPGTIGLYSSLDSFSTAITTFSQSPGSNFVNSVVSLAGLGSVSGTIEFRLIEVGNTQADGVGDTASGGTFRVTDYFGLVDGVNTELASFSITAIPEPSTYAAIFGGLALVGALVRRRMVRKA